MLESKLAQTTKNEIFVKLRFSSLRHRWP